MERRKALTVQEAIQLISEDSELGYDSAPANLVIVPPSTVDGLTDEEDNEDDIIGVDTSVQDVAGSIEAHLPEPPTVEGSAPAKKRAKSEQTARWRQTLRPFVSKDTTSE